jgi:O-antigen/teichoic acid export membrane protein
MTIFKVLAALPAETVPEQAGNRLLAALRESWHSDATMVMGGRVVGIIAGMATGILTARYLAPEGRGQYFIVMVTAQLVAQFGNLGLPSGNTYFVARNRLLFTGLLANSLWISFVFVPLMTAPLLILPIPGTDAMTPAAKWLTLGIAPLLVFGLLGSSLLLGLHQIKTFSVVQSLVSACAVPFMVIAAVTAAGTNGFLVASLAGSLVIGVILFVRLHRQSTGGMRFSADTFAATFRYSSKAYLVTLAGFFVLRTNVFILQALAGPAQVGYYSVASQIADTLAILPQSMAVVLLPRLAATSSGRVRATIQQGIPTAVLLGAICVAVWTLADPAIRLAFGPRFAPAVPVLRVMLPGVFLVGIMAVASQYLAASGFPIPVVVSWFAAVAFNAGLGRVLVARYGAFGAGLSLTLTYGALLLILILVCWRTAARPTPATAALAPLSIPEIGLRPR